MQRVGLFKCFSNLKITLVKTLFYITLSFFLYTPFANAQDVLEVGVLKNLIIPKKGKDFKIALNAAMTYSFNISQYGQDVVLIIINQDDKIIAEVDSPSGSYGIEKFDYKAKKDEFLTLRLNLFEEQDEIEGGHVNIRVAQYDRETVKSRKKYQRVLDRANRKNFQSLDVENFWVAYDALVDAKTTEDSIAVFQNLYIDRATDGFKEFIAVRPEMNAENYVQALRMFPKFYASLRSNTDIVSDAEDDIQYVFDRFGKVYDTFKPFKVCFAIGVLSTGGTVSNDYVLIGADITCSTSSVDLSEFKNPPYNQLIPHLNYSGNVRQKIRNIVAHECVHTQQPKHLDIAEQSCQLLHACLSEGFCDFVGEYIVGEQINANLQKFGYENEADLWNDFTADMCNGDHSDWLYNYGRFEDKPADLGYFIGYTIAKSYFENAQDKKAAIRELIDFTDAEAILKESKYLEKWK